MKHRDDAPITALCGSGPPDLPKLEPEEMEQKRKKHKNYFLPVIEIFNFLSLIQDYECK
jgi:hypothetical protein